MDACQWIHSLALWKEKVLGRFRLDEGRSGIEARRTTLHFSYRVSKTEHWTRLCWISLDCVERGPFSHKVCQGFEWNPDKPVAGVKKDISKKSQWDPCFTFSARLMTKLNGSLKNFSLFFFLKGMKPGKKLKHFWCTFALLMHVWCTVLVRQKCMWKQYSKRKTWGKIKCWLRCSSLAAAPGKVNSVRSHARFSDSSLK